MGLRYTQIFSKWYCLWTRDLDHGIRSFAIKSTNAPCVASCLEFLSLYLVGLTK